MGLEPYLGSCGDLLSLALCSRRLCDYFLDALYKHAVRGPCGRRALFWAVSNGKPTILRNLIDPTTTLDILWHHDESPDNIRALVPSAKSYPSSCLSPKGEDPGYRPERERLRMAPSPSWSLIHVAVASDNIEVLEILLNYGISTEVGCLGLCKCGIRPELLALPLEPERRIRALSHSWTALHVALCLGHTEAAKLLVSRGHTESMVEQTVWSDVHPFELTMLQERRALLTQPLEPRPLHGACMAGNLEFLRWVLEEHDIVQNVDALDTMGQTALCYAFLYGHWDCFDYLLSKGANINVVVEVDPAHQSRGQETLLSGALYQLRFKDTLRLISLGINADIMIQVHAGVAVQIAMYTCGLPWGESRDAPEDAAEVLDHFLSISTRGVDWVYLMTWGLISAAEKGNHLVISRVVAAGALIDGVPGHGTTPLISACDDKNVARRSKTISLLIESGASATLKNQSGQRPLWALFDAGVSGNVVEHPDQQAAIELLISGGAKPYRGTLTFKKPFTPLDTLLQKGHVEYFHRLIDMSGGKEALGKDDMLSFWDIVCAKSDPDLTRMILDIDEHTVIAQHARSPIQALLSLDPAPQDLVVRLLDKGASPDAQAGVSSITHAMTRGVDASLIKRLLDSGAGPRAVTASQPVFCHLLSATKSTTMDNEKRLAIASLLLDAGVSAYERVRNSPYHRLPDGVPTTHLGHAVQKKRGNEEIVKMLLEREPLARRSEAEVLQHLKHICRQGHRVGLESIVSFPEGDGVSIKNMISQNALLLTHLLLDDIYNANSDGTEVDAAIDCLRILLQHAQDGILDHPPPAKITDTRTLREKLVALLVDNGASSGDKMTIVTGCFRRRLKLEEGDLMPIFNSGWTSVVPLRQGNTEDKKRARE